MGARLVGRSSIGSEALAGEAEAEACPPGLDMVTGSIKGIMGCVVMFVVGVL